MKLINKKEKKISWVWLVQKNSYLKKLPTLVDPVKDIAATSGLLQSASPTSEAFLCSQVTTLMTPIFKKNNVFKRTNLKKPKNI